MNGWVKIFRSTMDWEWYKTENMVHLFLHLLLSANREDGKWRGISIKRGQFITGRKTLSECTGISEQSIRTCIKRLISTNEITIKPTNKYTIITICKYEDYQFAENNINQQIPNESTSNQPAINQQSTTNKNSKKIRIKETKKDAGQTSLPETKDHLDLMIDEFTKAYRITGNEYEILNVGKERAAMGKLAALYKKKYPNATSEDALIGMRNFFDRCMNVNDPWLKDNMSPSIIISKFNEINKILSNGNKRTSSKGGTTDAQLAEIIIRNFGKQ
jgi:hypothetical protein